MQVTRATFIPLLAPAISDRLDPGAVRDDYSGDLTVVYTFGPQFGRRVVTHADLEQMELPARVLRRSAFDHLEVLSSRAEFHGQPPALMLSFEGLESSLLFATDFWTRLQGAVPGELIVGVPARDVVVVTGSNSVVGLEKARRCVDRVFMAGDEHLLTRTLLVRRGGAWEPFDRPARQGGRPSAAPGHVHGRGEPPRQYQEHPSWPGERVPVTTTRPVSPMVPGGPGGRPMHAPPRFAPAAQMPTPPRPAANTLPPASPMPPSGFPIAGPMSPAGTMRPPMSVPRQRSAPGRAGFDHPSHPSHIAPNSAVPYSAMPYSAVPRSAVPYSGAPYSAVPYSAIPYSAMPYSAVPNSGSPYSIAPRSGGPHTSAGRMHGAPRTAYEPKPAYRDEPYSTGSYPRQPYPEYAPVSSAPSSGFAGYAPEPQRPPEAPQPVYPASWDYSPEVAQARPEQRVGPRARFSR